jgi:gluconolactonase
LFDTRSLVSPERKGLPDGLKVDEKGHLFATGPGGVLVLSPEGKHLGSILTGQATANCAWGDDGSTLYLTTHMFFARVKTRTRGTGFGGEEKRP